MLDAACLPGADSTSSVFAFISYLALHLFFLESGFPPLPRRTRDIHLLKSSLWHGSSFLTPFESFCEDEDLTIVLSSPATAMSLLERNDEDLDWLECGVGAGVAGRATLRGRGRTGPKWASAATSEQSCDGRKSKEEDGAAPAAGPADEGERGGPERSKRGFAHLVHGSL